MGALTFGDLGISFAINFAITVAFLFAYSFFSVQPLCARVYFTKWFMLDDERAREDREKVSGGKLQYSLKTYLHAFDWMFVALRLPERELLTHAGLDMVVFLRMFKLGFKIFVPCMLLGAVMLFPTYYTANYLSSTPLTYSELDKITISNLAPGSPLYWVPWFCLWVFSLWALYLMRKEFAAVAQMRLDYMAENKKSAAQYTILVRQVPKDKTRTVAQQTEQFFNVVHKDNYLMTTPVFDARKLQKLEAAQDWTENKITELNIKLERKGKRPTHKIGKLGLMGEKVDSIEFYEEKLDEINDMILKERDRVMKDKKCIMPANFVSFKTQWGAAVAAQTQQCKDNTKWITTWAPDPNDVCWQNLPVNYMQLTTRKYAVAAVVAVTILFYTIPVGFVQGLASLDNLAKTFPFLQPVLNAPFINSLLTAVLPGLALMIFLAILPMFMKTLSTFEGYLSTSEIERAAAGKMFYFILVTVFLTNVLAGSAWTQLQAYLQHPETLPTALGTAITGASTFFITYTMINGWSAVAGEVFRLTPLILFQIKNFLLVRTPKERVNAMAPSGPHYVALLPMIELYFLLPFMFMVLAPLYLPFVVVFYVFGYIVYKNQFINVYNAEYELNGGYWPHFHLRAMSALILSQIAVICVFALKQVIVQTILLIPLPIITFLYHKTFITGPYESTFTSLALEEAMRKDTISEVSNPGFDTKGFLARKYLHPSLLNAYEVEDEESGGNQSEGENLRKMGKVTDVLRDTQGVDVSASSSYGGDSSTGGDSLVSVKRHPKSRGSSPSPVNMRSSAPASSQPPLESIQSASKYARPGLESGDEYGSANSGMEGESFVPVRSRDVTPTKRGKRSPSPRDTTPTRGRIGAPAAVPLSPPNQSEASLLRERQRS